ncbi:cell division topological specificity factor MinE [Thermocrinis minervae]|uniref:Cell division topological specificity factor n=1 Tax=Thermocrinis minervae TaxID=381751 RepID=A0A1M6SUM1_9AQUI|nr:cell division topological specificity factor MinE [Thermocrinis minervae]SHK48403.1 cell division topological specificity factor [Thermocrinis minervae]
MFGFFRNRNSKDVAKKRLTMVLAYERKGLPPNFAELIKNDLIHLFSKYPQFNSQGIEVEIKKGEGGFEELWIGIPFKE